MDDLTMSVLTANSGKIYCLSNIIGQGAQGTIYNTSDDEHVIKLYGTESQIKSQRRLKKLKWLFKLDYPDQFIKPIDIFETPYIGYAMKKVKGHISLNKLLVPNREVSFSEWYNQNTGGLYRRLLVGQKIALQFANLHKKNMAYCDLSGSNILVNEDIGINSVCMIDIDNVYIPGAEEVNVLGTSRYMAPEILTKQINPDIFTDNYSLAVILFELLRVGHPYIGDIIEDGTPEQMTEAYKGLYPYVDDPNTDFNRSSQMLPPDVVFTTQLKRFFQKVFVDGKENRILRGRAQEFALALQRASNLVIKCPSCNNWHYAKPDNNRKYVCPWCDQPYEKPMRIAFYEKYNCKMNGNKVQIADKHLNDFILKNKSKNIVTKNYIKTIYEENDDALDEYFSVRMAKNGKFYLINSSGNTIALKKSDENEFSLIEKGEKKELDLKDTMIFVNPEDLQNNNIGNNVKGVSFRYAVIKQ